MRAHTHTHAHVFRQQLLPREIRREKGRMEKKAGLRLPHTKCEEQKSINLYIELKKKDAPRKSDTQSSYCACPKT